MERQQYTNLWAEKLLQVSMPDSDEAWAAMEAILDKEMSQARAKDRRRWVLLILLLLLLIGVCNCPGRGRFFHGLWTSSKLMHPQAVIPAANTPAANTPAVKSPAQNTPAVNTPVTNTPVMNTPLQPVTYPMTTGHPRGASLNHRRTTHLNQPEPVYADAGTTPDKQPAHSHPKRAHGIRHGRSGIVQPVAGSDTRTSGVNRSTSGVLKPTSGSPKPTPGILKSTSGIPNRDPGAPDPAAGTSDPLPSGANAPATPQNKPATTTLTPPKRIPKDSTHKKPAPKPQDQPPPEKQHGWMIGVGLNQFFPLGGQQGSTFNSNGLTGTLSDYLPVPMIRYYFNPRLYIQLEAQFNTPQPTKKNLVISSPAPDTTYRPGNTIVSTASLRQLYYFNVPLSVHFGPWKNVNIGTGLQFSHLSNAIGDFDSTITNIATSNVENLKATRSFKGDTLYQHLRTNEFRVLLDVNYTYKHFIFGLRYNQALTNFVNIRFVSGQVTQSRNSSLQLYLRYILFDSRKKRSATK